MEDKRVALIKDFEKSLTEDYKKDNGIFYTDHKIVKLMFKELNADKESIILDPCCGAGAFMLEAKQLGFKNIFGMDTDEKAVEKCREITRTWHYGKI